MIVQELIARLGFNSRHAEQQAARFDAAVDRLRVSLLAVTAAASVGAAGLFAAIRSTALEANRIAKAARDVGLATDAFQRLEYSAGLADLDQQSFGVSLKQFTTVVGKARNEGGTYAETFARLNVAIREADGSVRSQSDILLDIADRFKNIDSEAVRAAHAQELFGRSGARVGSWLAQGSDALREQGEELDKLGGRIPQVAILASERIHAGMRFVRAAAIGFRNMLANEFLPGAAAMLDRFVEWYQKAGEVIRSSVAGLARRVASAILLAARAAMAMAKVMLRTVTALGGIEMTVRLVVSALGVLALPRVARLLALLVRAALRVKTVAKFLVAALIKTGIGGLYLALGLVLEDLVSWGQGFDSVAGRIFGPIGEAAAKLRKLWADIVQAMRDAFRFAISIPELGSNFVGNLAKPALEAAVNFVAGAPDSARIVGEVPLPLIDQRALSLALDLTIDVPAGSPQSQAAAIERQIESQINTRFRPAVHAALAGA